MKTDACVSVDAVSSFPPQKKLSKGHVSRIRRIQLGNSVRELMRLQGQTQTLQQSYQAKHRTDVREI